MHYNLFCIQYNFAVDDFFGNFLQYVNVSTERVLRSLREPIDRSRLGVNFHLEETA